MYIHVWIYVLLLRMMQCSNSARLKMSPKAYERNMLSVSMYEYTYVWVHVCVHLIRATPIEGHPLQRGGGWPDNQKGVDQQAVVQVDEQTHRHRRILIHRWVCACIHKCKAHAWHTYIELSLPVISMACSRETPSMKCVHILWVSRFMLSDPADEEKAADEESFTKYMHVCTIVVMLYILLQFIDSSMF